MHPHWLLPAQASDDGGILAASASASFPEVRARSPATSSGSTTPYEATGVRDGRSIDRGRERFQAANPHRGGYAFRHHSQDDPSTGLAR